MKLLKYQIITDNYRKVLQKQQNTVFIKKVSVQQFKKCEIFSVNSARANSPTDAIARVIEVILPQH